MNNSNPNDKPTGSLKSYAMDVPCVGADSEYCAGFNHALILAESVLDTGDCSKLTASRQLRDEIHSAITRYGKESNVTVYQALGVLEIVKIDLVDLLTKGTTEN